MLRKKLKLQPLIDQSEPSVAERILTKEREVSTLLDDINYEDRIKYVYNPLKYAYELHANYVRKYCDGPKRILFLGINPGSYGMVQTGVPFGEVKIVTEWFKLDGKVDKPSVECPKRPVKGLEITVSEVSGKRFWGYFKTLCGEPEIFFKNSYVHNYCPLTFLTENGCNVTPDELQVRFFF